MLADLPVSQLVRVSEVVTDQFYAIGNLAQLDIEVCLLYPGWILIRPASCPRRPPQSQAQFPTCCYHPSPVRGFSSTWLPCILLLRLTTSWRGILCLAALRGHCVTVAFVALSLSQADESLVLLIPCCTCFSAPL